MSLTLRLKRRDTTAFLSAAPSDSVLALKRRLARALGLADADGAAPAITLYAGGAAEGRLRDDAALLGTIARIADGAIVGYTLADDEPLDITDFAAAAAAARSA